LLSRKACGRGSFPPQGGKGSKQTTGDLLAQGTGPSVGAQQGSDGGQQATDAGATSSMESALRAKALESLGKGRQRRRIVRVAGDVVDSGPSRRVVRVVDGGGDGGRSRPYRQVVQVAGGGEGRRPRHQDRATRKGAGGGRSMVGSGHRDLARKRAGGGKDLRDRALPRRTVYVQRLSGKDSGYSVVPSRPQKGQ
jgi:hypothetical protein